MITKFDKGRRRFLISSVGGVASLVFAESTLSKGTQAIDLLNPASPLVLPSNFKPSIWFTMESNGRTTVHCFKVEMGQHIATSYAQIVCEELGLDWRNVTIDYPQFDSKTNQIYGDQSTGGSTSVYDQFDILSRVAAASREIILESGADLLGAEISDCIAENSVVKDSLMGEKISFSEILSETIIDHEVTQDDLKAIKLKDRSEYKIIGKSVRALDIPEKVNGSARYGIDAHIPNMVYGKIIVPPKRIGAKIVSVDDKEAKKVSGYITTIPFKFPKEAQGALKKGFIAEVPMVIASNYPSAMRAAKVVRVDWDTSECSSLSSSDFVKDALEILNQKTKGALWWKTGNYKKLSVKPNVKEIERVYKTAMVNHAAIEPTAALVNVVNGVVHIYAGHQNGGSIPQIISWFTGVSPDKIVYHPHLIGGSFGHRGELEVLVLATLGALNLKKPLKVIFSREDDMAFAHPRTSTVQKLKSLTFDDDVIGLSHDVAGGSMQIQDVMPSMISWGKIDGISLEGKENSKPLFEGDILGTDNWYDIENQISFHHRQASVENTVPCRAVRAVANNYTVFALESFIDETCHEIGEDPLNFRLSKLKGKKLNKGSKKLDPKPASYGGGKRLANVLRIASGLSNYGSDNLPENCGIGIAVTGAEKRSMPTFCACVAQVAVDISSAAIDVQKLTCVIDVGIAINPDGIKAQVEGSLLWGLSSALYEKMTVENGRIVERNFNSYNWQNVTKIPELDIHIVENGIYPSGVGEPATVVVAPAIGNAIFNATGIRLRSIPFSREELFEELDKKT